MSSKTETVLEALRARIGSISSVTVQRNTAVPESVLAGGLIVLRDGDAGEPEQALGGFTPVYYRHAVELEIYAESREQAIRDQAFDDLAMAIGMALDADPTLGGLVFGITYGRPDVMTEAVEGGPAIKTGTITLVLDYEAPSPLG